MSKNCRHTKLCFGEGGCKIFCTRCGHTWTSINELRDASGMVRLELNFSQFNLGLGHRDVRLDAGEWPRER